MKYFQTVATNLQDVKDMQGSCINSIELCADIKEGGRTPDYQLIKEACEISKIPIHVMVRHRTDFMFDPSDYNQLLKDILFIRQTKAEAIVVGFLNANKTIDMHHMREICLNAYPLKVTFHKAFDEIADQKTALHELVQLGVHCVLTQGGSQKAIGDNIKHLQDLVNMQLPIKILLGGGINPENYPALSKHFDNIHVNTLVRKDYSATQKFDAGMCNKYIQTATRK